MTPLMPITTINIIAALALTTVTGGIVTIVWEIIGIVLERIGFFHVRYELLKLVTFFYLVPVSYIVIILQGMCDRNTFLFSPTPAIGTACMIAITIWLVGGSFIFARLLLEIYSQKKKFRDAIPCEKSVEKQFQDVMRQLGIKDGKVQIRQSYRADIACITGILKPRVILPVHNYTGDNLKIILLHELNHYKQRDITLKVITYVVLAIHHFNPFAWYLFYQVQKLSEIACDYKVCNRLGSMNEYYETLLLIAIDRSKASRLSPQLVERKHDLVERAQKMKKIFGKTKRTKWSVAVVVCIMFLASSMSVYAASVEGVEEYHEWYNVTDMAKEDAVIDTELMEYTESGDAENIETMVVDNGIVTYGLANINWTVKNNVKAATGYFNCEVGDTIGISVIIDPSDVTVKVGIEYADGSKRYVNGSGTTSHDFEITKAGYYRVYIENLSGETITVAGAYSTP